MSEHGDRVIRPRAAIVWAGITGLVVSALVIDLTIRGSAEQVLRALPVLALLGWFVWVFLVSPRVKVTDAGALVVNPLRRIWVGWGAITDITLRWQVELHVGGDRPVQAWGVPVRRPRRAARQHRKHEDIDDAAVGERDILVDAWQRARDGASNEVRRSWDVVALVALAAIVLGGAIVYASAPG